jgi:thiol-disulfide isomerase/thioredoxin
MRAAMSLRRRARVLYALLPMFAAASCSGGEKPPPTETPTASGEAAGAASATAAEWSSDYDAAIARAGREKKAVLAFFTGSDWCPPCKKLTAEVFSTPEFASWAARHAVLVEFDFPRGYQLEPTLKARNDSFARVLNVTKFPTVVFMDAAGQELGRLGYVAGGPEAWLAEAEKRLKR